MNKKNTIIKWRVYFVLGCFLVVALVIFAQLYIVQIVRGETYSQRSERQHVRPTSNIFDRGSIYFQTKDGEQIGAASLRSGYKIAIVPKNITHPEDVYNNLGFYLDLDEEFYISRAEKRDDPYEEIAKRVDYETGQKIKDLRINGVSIIPENWRYYPANDLAAHALGFVAFGGDDNQLRGQYGLERYYEDVLSRDHSRVFSNFFVEMFSGVGKSVSNSESGSNESSLRGSLVTTIDPDIQSFVANELKDLRSKWGSKTVGAIVMNPQTGAIKSMALNPTFNLNEFNLVDNASIYTNHLVESVYEMGSIVKPLTVAIGLDTGSITAETTYNDKGSLTLNTETIYNYDKRGRGVVPMQEILNQSLNTGVAFIESRVGNDAFADYMKRLFGGITGIDLPGEQWPLLSNLDSKNDIEYATASYGQGIAMTPVSITRALATLGNGGKLVTPHLVEKIEYDLGFSKDVSPDPKDFEQIFSEETSEEISRMLTIVVDEALRGGTVALDNYSIAAKTGTAQIARDGAAGYYDDRFLHSFFGYFPAYDPEFIVFLYNIEPVGAQYASETLTEPFMNIAKFLINHYEIPADRDVQNDDQ